MSVRVVISNLDSLNDEIPMEEGDNTNGYIFLEFTNHSYVIEAIKITNHYKLDK